jgi:4'-phosphopantetheinyl transferase EntD
MIEEILPSGVVPAEAFDELPPDPAEPATLPFPEETAAVARAVPRRQREFATVRACARRALGALGLPPVPLLPGRRGAPQWPEGVVGSMTHCDGYRAAAVAHASDTLAIGIDAEPNGPLPDGVLAAVALPRERAQVRALGGTDPEVRWDRLLFSAKESVFKTWYPLTGRELDFDEADIELDPAAGTFTARLLVPGPVVAGRPLDGFTGRWLARDGLVVTAITLNRHGPRHPEPVHRP